MYRIGINASFLRKPYTGIGQVTTQFLRELFSRREYVIGSRRIRADEVRFFLYVDDAKNIDKRYSGNRTFARDQEGVSAGRVVREIALSYKRDDLMRKWLFERFAIPRIARRDNLDAFISLYQSATVFPRWSKIHHVMVVHDIIPEVVDGYLDNTRKKFSWQSVKRGMRRAQRIIAVSSYTEKDIIRSLGIHEKNISVAHIDVDPIFSQPVSDDRIAMIKNHYHISHPYFFYGGGLEKRKNVEGVIRAYQKLLREASSPDDVPDLVISGMLLPQLAPLIVDVETLTRECNLTSKVRILGTVAQHDLPVLYAGALAFVFPSFYEGFGMPVLEAMRSGTPVITTKKTSLPEVAGDAVKYCDGSIEDIAKALQEVWTNEALRNELRRRGVSRSQLFSWGRFTDTILGNLIR